GVRVHNHAHIVPCGRVRLQNTPLENTEAFPLWLGGKPLPCEGASPWHPKKRAAQSRIAPQHRQQERASAAAYVEQPFMATKIVGGRQRCRHRSRERFNPA